MSSACAALNMSNSSQDPKMIDRGEFRDLEVKVDALVGSNIRLQEQVGSLERLVIELVTKAEFAPVKLIAYGLATAVLSSVLMAVMARVLIK